MLRPEAAHSRWGHDAHEISPLILSEVTIPANSFRPRKILMHSMDLAAVALQFPFNSDVLVEEKGTGSATPFREKVGTMLLFGGLV
jgi:hypothetical protein